MTNRAQNMVLFSVALSFFSLGVALVNLVWVLSK